MGTVTKWHVLPGGPNTLYRSFVPCNVVVIYARTAPLSFFAMSSTNPDDHRKKTEGHRGGWGTETKRIRTNETREAFFLPRGREKQKEKKRKTYTKKTKGRKEWK